MPLDFPATTVSAWFGWCELAMVNWRSRPKRASRFVHDADRDFDSGGDGADGFPAPAAAHDSLRLRLSPSGLVVGRPPLIEKVEARIDGRRWIGLTGGHELNLQGKPDVEADLFAWLL